MNPPSHTWDGDGGKSPGDPAESQATDINLYSDLLASAPTATADVCSLQLHPVQWPSPVASSCQQGCLPFWPWDQQGAGRVGRGGGAWLATRGRGLASTGLCAWQMVSSAKSSVGGGHFCVTASSWATICLMFLILSVVPGSSPGYLEVLLF